MRLDHLLSKELWHTPSSFETSRPRWPVHAEERELQSIHWLFDRRTRSRLAASTPGNRSGTREPAIGPGCRAHCSVLRVRALGRGQRRDKATRLVDSDLENSIASASIYNSQVIKGLRWMPWRQEPMKDARDCEKLRGAVNEALIRRCPNGETRPGSCPVTQV